MATKTDPEIPGDEEETFETAWNVKPAPRKVAIPPDTYTTVVESVKPAKASTGSEGVTVTFRITAGPFAGSTIQPYGIWVNLPASTTPENRQKSQEKAMRELQDLGFTGPKQIYNPPSPPARPFSVIVIKDDKNPLGKIYSFNPA